MRKFTGILVMIFVLGVFTLCPAEEVTNAFMIKEYRKLVQINKITNMMLERDVKYIVILMSNKTNKSLMEKFEKDWIAVLKKAKTKIDVIENLITTFPFDDSNDDKDRVIEKIGENMEAVVAIHTVLIRIYVRVSNRAIEEFKKKFKEVIKEFENFLGEEV